MGLFNGHFIPLAFALMSKKRQVDYSRVLEFLPLSDRVRVILTDFEGAALKALREILQYFPNLRIQGCRFHFGQALIRRLKKLGLYREYETKGELYLLIRPFFYLPFVNKDQVQDAFLFCRHNLRKFLIFKIKHFPFSYYST